MSSRWVMLTAVSSQMAISGALAYEATTENAVEAILAKGSAICSQLIDRMTSEGDKMRKPDYVSSPVDIERMQLMLDYGEVCRELVNAEALIKLEKVMGSNN
jgi:hypothetical protein